MPPQKETVDSVVLVCFGYRSYISSKRLTVIAHKKTVDYLYDEALKYGYDVYKQEFTEIYTDTARVVGDLDGVELALGSFRGSPSTDGNLTASLVAVNVPGCLTVIYSY